MQNIFITIKTAFRRIHSRAVFDPARDWLILIMLSTIALVCIIIWNVWAFNTVASGGNIGAPVAKTSASIDSASLETIRAVFEERAAEEAKYRTGAYRYADPSQ